MRSLILKDSKLPEPNEKVFGLVILDSESRQIGPELSFTALDVLGMIDELPDGRLESTRVLRGKLAQWKVDALKAMEREII